MACVSGVVIWQQWCRGNTSGQSLVSSARDALQQRLPRWDLLRLDGGFLSAKVLNLLVTRKVGFLTKASSKLKSIRTLLEQTPPEEWPSYDENTRLRRYSPVRLLDDFVTPVTVVLVECHRRVKKMKKGRLRWRAKLLPYAIVTDRHHGHTAKISETYKARWAVETFLQGVEPVIPFGQVALQPVPGQPVLPGIALRGVQPDAVVQAGVPAEELPDGELRHGAAVLPGACGGDRGAWGGSDPLDLQ